MIYTLIICAAVGFSCGFRDAISYPSKAECEEALSKIVIVRSENNKPFLAYCRPGELQQ